ncbi:MAG: HAD hydrolase-like protein [Nitrososphaerales archaeon]
MYRYLIFDLDGTVTDSKEGIVRCVNHALKSCGFPEVKQDRDLSWFVGPPLRVGFKELVGTSDDSLIERLVATYRERYATIGLYENVLYPGIAELLSDLFDREKVLILATSKPTTYAKKILEYFELARLFDRIIGSELDGTRSSKEEVIKLSIGAYGGPTAGYVMIGDRGDDIIDARRNNVDSIGVLYGYGTALEVTESNPTFVAKTVEDIRTILLPEASLLH